MASSNDLKIHELDPVKVSETPVPTVVIGEEPLVLTPPPSSSTVTWGAPVDTVDMLPPLGSRGEVHLVLADFTIRAWNVATNSWVTVSGSGGGSPSSGTKNLFIQPNQPDVASILVDLLWIPVDAVTGIPQALSTWEVFTGSGNGDGGNLFIQQSAPTPTVDSLWIPLNADGSPKYLDQWVVMTGRGSIPGFGNSNLIIGQTLPATEPTGSLFIPLNPDETAKSFDQWRVFA